VLMSALQVAPRPAPSAAHKAGAQRRRRAGARRRSRCLTRCGAAAAGQEGDGAAAPGGRRAWQWRQPVSTCSYLIAIAVGELASRDISPRCRVWTEPSELDKVAHDFAPPTPPPSY
jgi:hypothetical protein